MNNFIDVTEKEREDYNQVITHPLQSYEWGEFREKTGVKVIRKALIHNKKIIDGFTLTLHKVPGIPYYVGYLPKGNGPTLEVLEELKRIGKEEKCIYIQLEPNVVSDEMSNIKSQISNLQPSFHPLFTPYTFVLDLTPDEETLLKNMHQKTRYNIKIARKNNVEIQEDNSNTAFETYLKLTEETTKRQGFYAHTPSYHKNMWQTLKAKNEKRKEESKNNELSAHLFVAYYHPVPLTTWIVFVFHDTLYYPYGASSREHREVMASNLLMWEVIKFGKKMGLKKFDMWGALGENPDTKDPWYGFHRFKQGYGGKLVKFAGSYDLVIHPLLYQGMKVADKVRWMYLRFKK